METLESSRAGAPLRSRRRWWAETRSSALLAALVAVGGAVLIGGLTSVAQQYLPPWINSLSNSAGGWTMFSFLIVWLSRARPVLAGVLGVVVFQLLVESYSVVTEWRGFDDGDPFSSVWTVVGLVAGPLLGVAAGLARYGSPRWRALAVTPLAAVLLGEGIWALSTIVDTTSPVYWSLEVLLSVGFITAALVGVHRLGATTPRTGTAWRFSVLVVGVWLAGTGAFLFVWMFVLG